MARYGFKVYQVQLRKGRGHKNQPWSTASEPHHALALSKSKAILQSSLIPTNLQMKEIAAAMSMPVADLASTKSRVARFERMSVRGTRISIKIKYGMTGDFDETMGANGDESLANKATSRVYRSEFLMPPDGTAPALLAVETIGGITPTTPVIKSLALASRLSAVADEKPENWWALHCEQVSDPDFLIELMESSNDAHVVLKQTADDGTGGRATTLYRVEAPMNLVRRGRVRAWLGLPPTKRSAEGLVGIQRIVDLTDVSGMEFNDGYVRIDDGEASTQVRPDDAKDSFTYPLGVDRPSDKRWRKAIKQRFQILDPALEWAEP